MEAETHFEYDAIGNLVSRTNPRGVVTDFEMTALNEMVVETRGAEVSEAVTSGQLVTGESAFAYQRRYAYDANGRMVSSEIEDRSSVSTTASKGM
mgnify:CR=1 FL=1